MVIDTSKKPLAARISPNAPAGPKNAGARKVAAAKTALNKKKAGPAAKKQNKPKPKQKKKTVEELDQEMADYFDN